MLRVRQMLLEHFGYEVWPTKSVEAATVIAGDNCPDMLLIDNGYPGVNVEQVAERIKTACPGILAVVLSPFFAVHRSTRTAVDRFLSKDEGPDVLRANLEELFATQASGDASSATT